MDKLITNSEVVRENLRSRINDFAEHQISFHVWEEIPDDMLKSAFECLSGIDPRNLSFEEWQVASSRITKPLYSVAIDNFQVVSIVISFTVINQRSMNLWHTKDQYRKRGIGKRVICELLNYEFEHKNTDKVYAWDITSLVVDKFLISLGFT